MIDVWTHGATAPAAGLNEMCPHYKIERSDLNTSCHAIPLLPNPAGRSPTPPSGPSLLFVFLFESLRFHLEPIRRLSSCSEMNRASGSLHL